MSSSRYRDYVEEQLPNRFVHETLKGFMTYSIVGTTCDLEEIYIIPECRRQGEASKMYTDIGEVARERGCTHLKGTIIVGTSNAENSMKCLFKNGFRLVGTDGVVIHLMKKIGE